MLKLYNTMTRKQDPFKPRGRDKKVRIFTCGASIYRRPHIGNYRTFLYEDILVRYLEYLGYSVDRVINFTDVEDKAIFEAKNQHQTVKQTTVAVAKHFFEESRLLKIKLPPEIPRSSTTVDGAVNIIEKLIKKGYAYWHNGNVFFDPLKFKDFGSLFRLDMRRWPKKKVRFSRDTYTGNRWNLGDFILWHGYRDGDTTWWDTAIGKGRPSWNIQDPAIIVEHLGYKVDINCGGIDNIYRHHDYNIAIMESLSGETYAKYYLHGAHLIVEGKTMSKSRGNILFPEDVLQQGYKPHHLRFFLVYTHYRKKLNYNSRTMKRTAALLDSFRLVTARILKARPEGRKDNPTGAELVEAVQRDFEAHMNSDLGVGTAFDSIFSHLVKLDKMREKGLLSQGHVKKLRETLERIDGVWNVIF